MMGPNGGKMKKYLVSFAFVVAVMGNYPAYGTFYEFICRHTYGDKNYHRVLIEAIYNESSRGVFYLTESQIEAMNDVYLQRKGVR